MSFIQKYERINIDDIVILYTTYPNEFIYFCNENKLKIPNILSNSGKSLSAMLHNIDKYWDRVSCDLFIKKFNIKSKDSIQLFNKHSQFGIKTNSGIEIGKYYIIFPYSLSNKHLMRKNFKFIGSNEEKNIEIEKIKSTIMNDYINVPNDKWQLGHKNPMSVDNSELNLILQPPIQSKYRDEYLFYDTLTKMPLPKKLKKILNSKDIKLTETQIDEYIKLFTDLKICK